MVITKIYNPPPLNFVSRKQKDVVKWNTIEAVDNDYTN